MMRIIPLGRTISSRAPSGRAPTGPASVYPTAEGIALEIGVILAVTLALSFAVTVVLNACGLG